MSLDNLNLTLAMFFPFVTGYALISVLFYKDRVSLLWKASLAFGAGTGLSSLIMMLLGALEFPLTRLTVSLSLGLVLCLLLGLLILLDAKQLCPFQCQPPEEKPAKTPNVGFGEMLLRFLLYAYIMLNLLFAFQRAFTLPVHSWDGLATVAFKAKIFYFEGRLPHLNSLPHPTYPLLTPFNETWIALNLGRWSDTLIKIIFPFALVSFLMGVYHFLKTFTNKTWALIGLAVLLSSNLFLFHATISYRDFFLMYYNCFVIMLLCLWAREPKSAYLITASLFAAFAVFTKLEGTAFLLVYFLLFLPLSFGDKIRTSKVKIIDFFKFSVPPITMAMLFHAYKIANHVLQDGTGANDKTALILSWQRLKLIPNVIVKFSREIFLTGNWSLIWVALLLSLIQLMEKKDTHTIKILGISILLFFGLYGGVALFTNNYPWIAGAKSIASLSRLVLHFFPLSVLMLILLNYPNPKNKK